MTSGCAEPHAPPYVEGWSREKAFGRLLTKRCHVCASSQCLAPSWERGRTSCSVAHSQGPPRLAAGSDGRGRGAGSAAIPGSRRPARGGQQSADACDQDAHRHRARPCEGRTYLVLILAIDAKGGSNPPKVRF